MNTDEMLREILYLLRLNEWRASAPYPQIQNGGPDGQRAWDIHIENVKNWKALKPLPFSDEGAER
jgi:hypothetical protein